MPIRRFKFCRLPALAVALMLLAGCGAQYIRDSGLDQLKAGRYEQALKTIDDGVASHPDSVLLRSAQLNARETAAARLLAAASAARLAGNDKQADANLQRLLALSPNDSRAKAMQLDVERDRRRNAALASANELMAQGLRERAMLVIESALKDTPNDAGLLALQRTQELASRQSELNATQLAETRPISLDFKDGNLRMILDLLTRSSGISFVIDKDVRPDVRTTIFLRDTRLVDALEMIVATNQLAYKVLDSASVLIYPRTPEKLKEYQDLVIRTFYLSNADVKQTGAMLKTMLKIREPFIDEKLNLIMVRETPETIRLAERLIALHDLAEPEVMMEVEVLEIKRASLTELGIKYPDSFSLTPLVPAGGFTLANVGAINRAGIGINVPGIGINLHRDVGDVNILANPKIRARNRDKAKIMIGDKLPVVTTTGSSNNSGFISESVQYVDVGLKLEVEPDIHLNDEVAIKVGLEVSSLVREIKTSSGSLVYQIGNRTANTVLRLRDGETQVLAGLISNEERMSASRLPGLGDLPVLGRLFGSQRNDGQRTEIVLSITPRIVRNIRRPDLNQTEFWSGTENTLRSRALTLPAADKQSTPGALAPANAGAAWPPPPLPGAPPAVVPFSIALAAPAEVKLGQEFMVQVNIASGTPLRGMPIELEFARDKLQIVDAEEGDFFKQDGAQVSKSKSLGQAEGRVSMALLRNIADGVKGAGTAVTLKFKAIAAGPAELRVVSAKPIASSPVEPPVLPGPTAILVK